MKGEARIKRRKIFSCNWGEISIQSHYIVKEFLSLAQTTEKFKAEKWNFQMFSSFLKAKYTAYHIRKMSPSAIISNYSTSGPNFKKLLYPSTKMTHM